MNAIRMFAFGAALLITAFLLRVVVYSTTVQQPIHGAAAAEIGWPERAATICLPVCASRWCARYAKLTRRSGWPSPVRWSKLAEWPRTIVVTLTPLNLRRLARRTERVPVPLDACTAVRTAALLHIESDARRRTPQLPRQVPIAPLDPLNHRP